MPSVKLLLTVSEELYEAFVLPKKQQKGLNKAVIGLMSSYVNDDYVRSHVDGDLRTASVNAIEELKDSLSDVLASGDQKLAFGAATTQAGLESMQRTVDGISTSTESEERSTVGVSQEDFEAKFNEVNERFDALTSLLEKFIVSGVQTVTSVAETVPVVASAAGDGSWGSGVQETGMGVSAAREQRETEIRPEPIIDTVKPVVVEAPRVVTEEPVYVPVVATEVEDEAPLGTDEEVEENSSEAMNMLMSFGAGFNAGGL